MVCSSRRETNGGSRQVGQLSGQKFGHALTADFRLSMEIARFYEFAKPTELEALAREKIISQVRQDVQKTLPMHDVEVFGSERTGLAMATSDIDFRLLKKGQIDDDAHSGLPPEPKERIKGLRALQNLRNKGFVSHKLYPISMLRYARYPLISLQDRHSGLDLQIVLSNDTSLSRKFIQDYTEQYPYLRAVYFVVKTTFDIRGLSDVFRGGFGSYTLFMMIVASIQQKPHSRNDAAGCLLNFLEFYRDFDTTRHGLAVNPPTVFDKADVTIMPGKVASRLKVSARRINTLPAAH
jgi:non-canonical poly(A) RNA polymerase PAPD5/7